MALPEAIEAMRPSVVQISVLAVPGTDPARFERIIVNRGSGFLVGREEYAVTALHVVRDFQAAVLIQGQKTLVVGLALQNLDSYKSGRATITIRSAFTFIECEVVDEDVRHDLASLKLKQKPATRPLVGTPKERVGYPLHRAAKLSSPNHPVTAS